MDEQQLKIRTKRFALRVMRLTSSLPKTAEGRALANQLVRSGTSVGANYRAACRARSKADFIAKLAIAEEEADESAYWMELIIEGNVMKSNRVEPLRQEADELTAILTASRKTTAMQNRKSKIENRKSKQGLSIVELLLALSISAMLLTATMVALNASFHAYATAAESASTQSSLRLVMQRLLGMIRTTTLHDAYDPGDSSVGLVAGQRVRCVGIQMYDPNGELLRIYWKENTAYQETDLGDLWYQVDGGTEYPLLEHVRARRDDPDSGPYVFKLSSRSEDQELLLTQAVVDLEVEPGADATLAMESVRGASGAVRMVGSTIPRRNIP